MEKPQTEKPQVEVPFAENAGQINTYLKNTYLKNTKEKSKKHIILQLHKIMFSHTDSSHGGQFKNVQNYIRATMTDGSSFILFTPLAPWETKEAMQQLCDAFNLAIGEGTVDPLILIPAFVHDFLCIHPFIDGNGRMSRLLTTLLLYRSRYYVGRYISLKAQTAKTKDYYYDALKQSQNEWHEQSDDPAPFIKYILGTVIAACRDFIENPLKTEGFQGGW